MRAVIHEKPSPMQRLNILQYTQENIEPLKHRNRRSDIFHRHREKIKIKPLETTAKSRVTMYWRIYL